MLFAEHPSYRHLHVHVVPRMSWFAEEEGGPAVFRDLNVPEDGCVPTADRERLSRAIAARSESELTAI
jgi:diadenosine tetraphosphate (Ap4A) HIT family hydrolase